MKKLLILCCAFVFAFNIAAHSQSFAWSDLMKVKDIQTGITGAVGVDQLVVNCVYTSSGNPINPMVFAYGCIYGQCDNGKNTIERAKQILAVLLAAQANDKSIQLNFANLGNILYFNGAKIVN